MLRLKPFFLRLACLLVTQTDFFCNQQQRDSVDRILWVVLGAYYTMLAPKRNVLGTDYDFHVVLFVFDFEQADGREVSRLPCMSYQHTVLGTEEALC